MKTKTKKKIKHVVFKKKLLKKQQQQNVLKSVMALLVVATLYSAVVTVIGASSVPLSVEVGATTPRHVQRPEPEPAKVTPVAATGPVGQTGKASWYALGLRSPDALTCASTTYPRGTYLEVRNLRNGRVVTCLVNDYGPQPYTKRVIDLSRGSFSSIESLGTGVVEVQVRVTSAPAAGVIWPSPIDFNEAMGYRLCSQRRSDDWCDANRQKDRF